MRIDLLEVPYLEDFRRFWKLGFLLLGFDFPVLFWESHVITIFLVIDKSGLLGFARVLSFKGRRNEEERGIKEVAMVG